jgi:hypothetical protein
MNTATAWSPPSSGQWPQRIRGYLERVRDWLDDRGRVAWVVAIVAGFILLWPVGLAILFYTIWSNRMSCNSWGRRARRHSHSAAAPTGNVAFDTYRSETLKRLEEEREAFTSFLEQLRAAKDQAEFDQFMNGRRAPEPA